MNKYKRYLVKTNSDQEHFNADLDFAIIEFSAPMLRRLGELKTTFFEHQKQLPELLTWELRDNSVSFFSYNAAQTMLGEEAFEDMNSESGGDPYKLPDAAQVNQEKFDVSLSDEMVISASGVWWKINPAHSSVSVGSDFLAWAWFDQCHNCGLRRDEHARGHCLFNSTRYRATVPELAGKRKNRRKLVTPERVS